MLRKMIWQIANRTSQIARRKSHLAKEISLCFLSAILLILSFPRSDFWILSWFGFVPLFFALRNKSKIRAFLLSYLTGIIFWWGIIHWLVHVTFIGTFVLVLYLALYFAIFGLFFSQYSLLSTLYSLLSFPALWVILEYIRSHLFTGFPWALLGYSQYLNLPIIQIADVTGAFGVSFLVMMVNVLIYSVIAERLSVSARRQKYILAVLSMLIILTYGYYKIYRTPYTEHRTPLRISVIQGNVPQELKWEMGARDFIIEKYFTLTLRAAKDKPDLIIWPEAAVPIVLEEESAFYKRIKKFVKQTNTPLLLGAVTSKDTLYYNSALLFSRGGSALNRYDKLHLVPFGEYIPLKNVFPFLEVVVPIGDIMPGKEYTVFKIPNPKNNFAVLICFEDLFPKLSREFVRRGADFLINITNDAWYKRTAAAYQHLQASVFRAVENRIYLARAANTGVSGFIAPNGAIISLVDDEKTGRQIFVDGYKTQEIAIPKRDLSFYTRYGDIFIGACLLFVLYGIISLLLVKR